MSINTEYSAEYIKNFVNKYFLDDTSYSWRDNSSDKITSRFSNEEFLFFVKNYGDVIEYCSSGSNFSWTTRYIVQNCAEFILFENETKFIEEIKSGNVCSHLRRHLYSDGIFFSEDCHYYIATDESLSKDYRASAVKNIKSEELLKSLIKSKCAKVRAEAYRNLNTLEYIDEISKDRSGDVRIVGIEALPFGSEKLKLFILKERKSYNLKILAKKIGKKDLLFMINKKAKSNYINLEKIIKKRLEN